MSNKNVKSQEDEIMDVGKVYTMFEEVNGKMDKLLSAAKATPAPAPELAPALTSEDGEKIETLTAKLDRIDEKLDRPLKHYHTLDFMSNWVLIVLVVVSTGLLVSLWVIRNQREFRDNNLKYRYVKMLHGATPSEIQRLETNFTYDRNLDSIRSIRRRVEVYERLVKEQAEKSERARLNATEAQRLQNQAESVKGGK
jgi:hypothetical protein